MCFLKNNECNYMCEWIKSNFFSIFLFKQILRITSWKIFNVMQKIQPKERLSISNLLILQVTKEEALFTSSNILKLSSSSLSFSEQWCYLGSWKSQSNKKKYCFPQFKIEVANTDFLLAQDTVKVTFFFLVPSKPI